MSLKKNIAIIADDFVLGSPTQQVLDRFLIGYAHDGEFKKRPFENVTIFARAKENKLLEQRKRDFPHQTATSVKEAVQSADAVIFLSPGDLKEGIDSVRSGVPVFVYGVIGKTKSEAEAIARKAEAKNIPLCAGTVMAVLQELPPMQIPDEIAVGAQIREALIVVEGSAPEAELAAFDAIASVLDRNGGIRSIRHVRTLEGNAVWDAGGHDWSWRLLASALSRTDKAQGNTALDGRTEDIVGLGLTQKMAKNPRARIIEHSRGLRTAILVLDGVVGDILVAVKAGRRFMPGTIYSTQLFQPQTPQQEQFSQLAAVISDFLETGRPPWDIKRSLVAADFAERTSK
jgi:hypothetical protein